MVDHRNDRKVGRIIVGAFVLLLALAIAYVLVSQSGVVPGDSPVGGDAGTLTTQTAPANS